MKRALQYVGWVTVLAGLSYMCWATYVYSQVEISWLDRMGMVVGWAEHPGRQLFLRLGYGTFAAFIGLFLLQLSSVPARKEDGYQEARKNLFGSDVDLDKDITVMQTTTDRLSRLWNFPV